MTKDGGASGPQDGGTNEAGGKDANASLYENRGSKKKLIRVVTVLGYMFSVSFVAIVLSAYYLFLWQPPNPRLMHKLHMEESPQFEYFVADSPIVLSDHVDPQPGGSSGKSILALEIPLRAEENATVHGRGAFADPQSDLDHPRIVFDKTTFGHENPSKKSLSALRNSLIEVLRDRRANLSGLEEPQRDSEGTYKSKRTIGRNVYEARTGRPLQQSTQDPTSQSHSPVTAASKSVLANLVSALRADWNRNEEASTKDPPRESVDSRHENKSTADIQPTVNATDAPASPRNFPENPTDQGTSISRKETKEETQIELMTAKPAAATATLEETQTSEKTSKDMLTILTRIAKMNPTPSTFSAPTTLNDDIAELATTLESHITVPSLNRS